MTGTTGPDVDLVSFEPRVVGIEPSKPRLAVHPGGEDDPAVRQPGWLTVGVGAVGEAGRRTGRPIQQVEVGGPVPL